jgi:phosphoribosylamine--glycine ligase
MKVLVVGSGGREHAICWKFSQSRNVERIFCAPGNAGTGTIARNIQIAADDVAGLAQFAENEGIDLTFVGPEAPMEKGITDEFNRRGLVIFGPSAAAARLETSKEFAKEVMAGAGVPTARYEIVHTADDAKRAAEHFGRAAVKADGLAAGKGVIICTSSSEILDAVRTLKDQSLFGNAGDRIVVEELLEGDEASILAFCDGKTATIMVPSQDHKRIYDGDAGKNTGGMGAYAPTPVVQGLEKEIHDKVFVPVLREMSRRGTPYVGVLYAGLMVNGSEFRVLEFNARFGDPEAQPVLSLLETDLLDISQACIDGRLGDIDIKWKAGASCCVIAASKGYPDRYEKGKIIEGIEDAQKLDSVVVFHSGTKTEGGNIVTDGGRVLGVTATGASIKEAIASAYDGIKLIRFDGMHYRTDIGKAVTGRS